MKKTNNSLLTLKDLKNEGIKTSINYTDILELATQESIDNYFKTIEKFEKRKKDLIDSLKLRNIYKKELDNFLKEVEKIASKGSFSKCVIEYENVLADSSDNSILEKLFIKTISNTTRIFDSKRGTYVNGNSPFLSNYQLNIPKTFQFKVSTLIEDKIIGNSFLEKSRKEVLYTSKNIKISKSRFSRVIKEIEDYNNEVDDFYQSTKDINFSYDKIFRNIKNVSTRKILENTDPILYKKLNDLLTNI